MLSQIFVVYSTLSRVNDNEMSYIFLERKAKNKQKNSCRLAPFRLSGIFSRLTNQGRRNQGIRGVGDHILADHLTLSQLC